MFLFIVVTTKHAKAFLQRPFALQNQIVYGFLSLSNGTHQIEKDKKKGSFILKSFTERQTKKEKRQRQRERQKNKLKEKEKEKKRKTKEQVKRKRKRERQKNKSFLYTRADNWSVSQWK